MRPKSLLLLALALGCGLVASIGISQVMERNANRPTAKIDTAPIYVALHNINTGDPIDASMVSLQEWPKDKVPNGAVANLEELEGRRPRTAIIEGEPILEGKLLAPGQMADPIRSIPKGYRLKTIAVDAEKSAAGLLGPGDRVDIQLFVRRDERNGITSAKSKVILQNIRVFAVDQTVQRAEGGEERTVAKTVSLLLTPEQASKLGLAENLGEVSLIPRNPDDEDTGDWAEYSADDLLGSNEAGSRKAEQGADDAASGQTDLLSAVRQTTPPPRPPFIMEIVEAQDVREMRFDPDTGKPIREQPAAPSTSGPGVDQGAGVSAIPADGLEDTPKQEMEERLNDFPIDFEQPN
jgi:pilus assembly protein CpaB